MSSEMQQAATVGNKLAFPDNTSNERYLHCIMPGDDQAPIRLTIQAATKNAPEVFQSHGN